MKEFDAKLVFYKDCWLYILTVNEIHLRFNLLFDSTIYSVQYLRSL